MIPNLFTAYVLSNTDIANTTLIAAHVTHFAQGTFGRAYNGKILAATGGYSAVDTKNQVGKYSYLETEPGFDCSGFAWWAGKHAEVPLLKYRLTADDYYKKAKLSEEKICDELVDGSCDLSLLQQNIRAGDIVFYSQNQTNNM